MEKPFRFKVGDKVKDIVTGYKGVVAVRSQYMTGCNRYGVQNQELDEKGKPQEWVYFDEDLIVSNGKNIQPKIENPGGPPNMEAPQR